MTFREEMNEVSAEIVDAFGEPAIFKSNTIQVVFDNEFDGVGLFGVGIEGAVLAVLAKTADVTSANHADTLTIGATNYYIRGIQPDGTGMTRLILSED